MLRIGNSPADWEINFVLMVTTLSSSQGKFTGFASPAHTTRFHHRVTRRLAVGLCDRYRTGRLIYISEVNHLPGESDRSLVYVAYRKYTCTISKRVSGVRAKPRFDLSGRYS
jgi:hypothetical protein